MKPVERSPLPLACAAMRAHRLPIVLVVAVLGGCTSRELYHAGQQWQRQECQRLMDLEERKRCHASTARSYEDYKAEAEAARK